MRAGGLSRPCGELQRQLNLIVRDVGPPGHACEVLPRNRLQPDRLPDPGRPAVPDRVRLELPVLLASRLAEIVGVVLGPHDDVEVLFEGGHFDREGRVAALVRPDVDAADPHVRAVVDRAEMQKKGAALGVAGARDPRCVDAAAVPDDGAEPGVVDAGERGLGRVGDHDRAGELVGDAAPSISRDVIVVGEVPVAAQIEPAGTDELRARVGTVLRRGAELFIKHAGSLSRNSSAGNPLLTTRSQPAQRAPVVSRSTMVCGAIRWRPTPS